MFNIPYYLAVHNEGEVVVDVKDCAAIGELKRFVFEENVPLNYITEVKLSLIIKVYSAMHIAEQLSLHVIQFNGS